MAFLSLSPALIFPCPLRQNIPANCLSYAIVWLMLEGTTHPWWDTLDHSNVIRTWCSSVVIFLSHFRGEAIKQ